MTKASKKKSTVLTGRQLQCAEYLLQGKTARETAEMLGLSRRTVEYYLNTVKIKLECKNKVELILVIANLLKTNKKDNDQRKD